MEFAPKINLVTGINLIAEVTGLETYISYVCLSKQATIMLHPFCQGRPLRQREVIYLVKDNKVEVETSIGEVVEFRCAFGYPPKVLLSSVTKISV